ncbi:hypothetical protein ES703_68371 [subsurface metagenome]
MILLGQLFPGFGNHLTRLGVHHVSGQHAPGQPGGSGFSQRQILNQAKGPKDIFIGGIPDSPQQQGSGEFPPPVNDSVEAVVDIGGKVYPGAPEGDNPSLVNAGAVGMLAFLKEDTWGALKLTDDNPLGAVDDKGPPVGHVRDIAEENVLFDTLGIDRLVLFVGDVEDQPNPQGDGVTDPAVQTLPDRVFGLPEVVTDIFQDIVTVTVFDGEHAVEYFLQPFDFPLILGNLFLKKFFIGRGLDRQQIGYICNRTDMGKGIPLQSGSRSYRQRKPSFRRPRLP